MATTMRIIDTSSTVHGRTYAAYVFVLRPAECRQIDMLQLELLDPDGPHVMQSTPDHNGLRIYPGNTAGPRLDFCRAVVKLINRVLGTDYIATEGSFYSVDRYGIAAGGTRYDELLRDDQFRLPYMTPSD